METIPGSWPSVATEQVAWESGAPEGISRRAASRARGPYEAAVPAMIATLPVPAIDPELALTAEDAVLELARFDGEFG